VHAGHGTPGGESKRDRKGKKEDTANHGSDKIMIAIPATI
jgi:hypothetical protein